MQRIERIDETTATPVAAKLLADVKRQMGGVPNILGTMAQSPAALGGYIGLAGALAGGTFSAKLREQIALAVAGVNRCDYCASAHTAIGAKLGLPADELDRNLQGQSPDPKVEAVLQFTRRVLESRGRVTDADLAAVRAAGYVDGEIVEIVANTVLNIFTNYINHVAATEIDFPVVTTDPASAAA